MPPPTRLPPLLSLVLLLGGLAGARTSPGHASFRFHAQARRTSDPTAMQAETDRPLPGAPRLRLDGFQRLQNGNVGVTFLARAEGQTWFFKRGRSIRGVQRYGNFEAEVFVARLLQRLGFRVPQCRLVSVEGGDGVYLQVELVDREFLGGTSREEATAAVSRIGAGPGLEDLDAEMMTLLFLTDVITGNGDRHAGNFFLVPGPTGSLQPIPLDHNLSLATPAVSYAYINVHLTEGLDGLDAENPRVTRWVQPWGLPDPGNAPASGTPEDIAGRNRAYRKVLGGLRTYGDLSRRALRLSRMLRDQLDDATLLHLTSSLPPGAVFTQDPETRFAEIRRLVASRRDRLEAYIRGLAIQGEQVEGGRLATLEARLGPELMRALGLGAEDRLRLAASAFPPGSPKPSPLRLYRALRDLDVEALLARQAVERMARTSGERFPLRQLLEAEELMRGSRQSALPPGLEALSAGPGWRPLRFLRVRARADGLDFLDGLDRPVNRGALRPLHALLGTSIETAGLRPGECLELEYDPFRPGRYRVSRRRVRGSFEELDG